ncbi:MAG: DUF1552 domain-containing protein, partial [Gammaproteobacteria bacterium]|nr:DUF1552 domain-containing protein [Gammaproteobacteria bacterium]
VSLALPMLEAMTPVFAKQAQKPPQRMVFICTTLGLYPPSLWPKTPGREHESTEYLDLLKEHRGDFTLFSGLAHQSQAGRQPHNCEITWLTAARGPGLDGFRNTVSVDQLAAGRLGYVTRFPSITLGTQSAQSQSYTPSGVMVPAETSPAKMFARLFLQGKPREVELQKRKLSDGRSILDQLHSQAATLRRAASKEDNAHLEEYFESIRKAEKDIAEAEGWLNKPKPSVEEKQPKDIHDRTEYVGRIRLLIDMIPLILETDSSRVVSVMIQDHQVVPKVSGVSGQHHNLSHHGRDQTKIEQLRKIESEVVKCFGSLLTQMKSRTEAGAKLIDHTSILFGSNLGNANSHDPRNLPILLAGGGYKHGRYVAHKMADETPLCNLFLTMLNRIGLETESFGQSTRELSW